MNAFRSALISIAVLTLLSGCLKTREIELPGPKPKVDAGGNIVKGVLLINEVNNRWSPDLNLSNELSPVLARRFNPAIGDDWKDGKTKWLELYNNSTQPITIGDTSSGYWFLSDSRTNKTLSPINLKVTIPAGGYAIVFSSDTSIATPTQIHARFNIGRNNSAVKDTLGIYFRRQPTSSLITIDSLSYDDNDKTSTWSRLPDGASQLVKTRATPGTANAR